MKAVHFQSAADLRHWLEKHHATATELVLGLYKKTSGRGGLTYAEMVDELLCFGWIDGVKRRIDDERYCHRITPRRPDSIWSQRNVGHVERLKKAGRMHPAGLKAHAARFRADKTAWIFWQAQPPGYQRLTTHWVTSAKQEATRLRRLEKLITASAAGQRLFA